MNDTWRQTTLGKIASREGNGLVDGPFGSNLPASSYTETGVPVIRGSNLTLGLDRFNAESFVYVSNETAQRLSRSLCKPKDIVFTKKGTLGQTGLVPDNMFSQYLISSNQMKLTVDKSLADPFFVYYFVSSPQSVEKILRDSEATGVPKTNLTYLKDFPILLPKLREQKAIAHILGTLDDKIELNRQMNATLEAMAQALFKSWFVDFDPVIDNALAAGNPIPEPLQPRAQARAALGNQRKPLSAGLQKQFPDKFVFYEEIGWIPEGWKINSLNEFSDSFYDGPHATPPKSDTGKIFLGITNLTGTQIDTHSLRLIADKDWPQWTKRVIPQHLDVVFSYEATLGLFALIPPNFQCCLGRRLALIRPKSSNGYPHYLFHWLTADYFKIWIAQHTVHGATVDRIPLVSFPSFPILVPSDCIMSTFDVAASKYWQAIHTNLSQSQTLETLRDTLLPKLLSGQLRIPDAEKLAAEVV